MSNNPLPRWLRNYGPTVRQSCSIYWPGLASLYYFALAAVMLTGSLWIVLLAPLVAFIGLMFLRTMIDRIVRRQLDQYELKQYDERQRTINWITRRLRDNTQDETPTGPIDLG